MGLIAGSAGAGVGSIAGSAGVASPGAGVSPGVGKNPTGSCSVARTGASGSAAG